MRLYLVRHGEAKSAHEDPDRPLSHTGRRNVEKLAAFLKSLNLHVGAIWHSEKTRAVQTAQLLAAAVPAEKGSVQHPHLNPDDPVHPVKTKLKNLHHDLMIVGHLPFLPTLAAELLLVPQNPDLFTFPPAAILALQKSEDSWTLLWMIIPDLLKEKHP